MQLPEGLIFDIKRFSIHDGPGIRTTIFLKGCPLHCVWCHNPEGISPSKEFQFWSKRCIACHECIQACEYHALSIVENKPVRDDRLCQVCGACVEACPAEAMVLIGKKMTVQDVIQEIETDVLYYDQSGGGVTFSGGEPLLQIEFLDVLLQACKDRGIHTAVDTSGYVQLEDLQRIKEWVDLFLYDVKIIDEFKHLKYTGVSNRQILNNLIELSKSGAEIIIRIPIIPGINESSDDIDQLREFLEGMDRNHPVHLLPYHSTAIEKYSRMNSIYQLQDVRSPAADHLSKIAELLEISGLSVSIGG